MAALSRALARRDPLRVAAAALAVPLVLLLVAYAIGLATQSPTPGAVASAVALVGIAGSGLLYAWRLGAGGIVD
jgi:protein-S-isoprenylcysteine O-methyltransferase Ste14